MINYCSICLIICPIICDVLVQYITLGKRQKTGIKHLYTWTQRCRGASERLGCDKPGSDQNRFIYIPKDGGYYQLIWWAYWVCRGDEVLSSASAFPDNSTKNLPGGGIQNRAYREESTQTSVVFFNFKTRGMVESLSSFSITTDEGFSTWEASYPHMQALVRA